MMLPRYARGALVRSCRQCQRWLLAAIILLSSSMQVVFVAFVDELRDFRVLSRCCRSRGKADPAAGVALSVDATVARSHQIMPQLSSGSRHTIFSRPDLPLSVTALRLGSGNKRRCEDVRLVFANCCVWQSDQCRDAPDQIEIAIEATSLSPQGAWLCRSNRLGRRPACICCLESSMLRPDHSPSQRNRRERFWLQLWHLRKTRTLRVAYAPRRCIAMFIAVCRGRIGRSAFGLSADPRWVPRGYHLRRGSIAVRGR